MDFQLADEWLTGCNRTEAEGAQLTCTELTSDVKQSISLAD